MTTPTLPKHNRWCGTPLGCADCWAAARKAKKPVPKPKPPAKIRHNRTRLRFQSAEHLAARAMREKDIIDMRDAGITLKQIGEVFGVSRQRIEQIIRTAGAPATRIVRQQQEQERRPEIVALWREGHSRQQIQKKLKVGGLAIDRALQNVKRDYRPSMMGDKKRCSACREWLPLGEYHMSGFYANGDQRPYSACKKCWSAKQKVWHKQRKERQART